MTSQATWKVIAADMPIGVIVVYDTDRKWGVEAIAQSDGPPRGRELETSQLRGRPFKRWPARESVGLHLGEWSTLHRPHSRARAQPRATLQYGCHLPGML